MHILVTTSNDSVNLYDVDRQIDRSWPLGFDVYIPCNESPNAHPNMLSR